MVLGCLSQKDLLGFRLRQRRVKRRLADGDKSCLLVAAAEKVGLVTDMNCQRLRQLRQPQVLLVVIISRMCRDHSIVTV